MNTIFEAARSEALRALEDAEAMMARMGGSFYEREIQQLRRELVAAQ